jgi:hypothetical protein
MVGFVIGVAVGAAFAPFWMKVWGFVKDKVSSFKK